MRASKRDNLLFAHMDFRADVGRAELRPDVLSDSVKAFGDALKCCICMDFFVQPHQLPCSHMLCHSCALTWLQQDPRCPICKEEANRRSIEEHADLAAIIAQYHTCVAAMGGEMDDSGGPGSAESPSVAAPGHAPLRTRSLRQEAPVSQTVENVRTSELSAPDSGSSAVKCGDLVDVAARTGPGLNQHGGRAWVTAVQGDGKVDLKYVVEPRREKAVDPQFVSRVDMESGARRRSCVPSSHRSNPRDGCSAEPTSTRHREGTRLGSSTGAKRTPSPTARVGDLGIEEAAASAQDIPRATSGVKPPHEAGGACTANSSGEADDAVASDSLNAAFAVGALVEVQRRAWPGINQAGGVARVLSVERSEEHGSARYAVQYTLDNRKENDILAQYISSVSQLSRSTRHNRGLPPSDLAEIEQQRQIMRSLQPATQSTTRFAKAASAATAPLRTAQGEPSSATQNAPVVDDAASTSSIEPIPKQQRQSTNASSRRRAPAVPIEIVCTSVSKENQSNCKELASLLGGRLAESFNAKSTTHLVSSTSAGKITARTLKYMEALLTGKFIVSDDWVTACLASRQHLAEEEFEISGFREDGVDIHRRAREARAANKPRLFHGYRFALHAAKNATELKQRSDATSVIRTGGGRVVEDQGVAVKYEFLWDSISEFEVKNISDYAERTGPLRVTPPP